MSNNNIRFKEFYQASQNDLARAKAFAKSICEYPLDEEDVRIIKLAFPKASFKHIGTTEGAYDEEAHNELLREWQDKQKRRIQKILEDDTEWYQAKWEDSPYFGWCAVNFFPDDGKEYEGYYKVSKTELAEMLAEEEPYIDAGRRLENEYMLISIGNVIDPSGFDYVTERGFNI